MGSAAPLSTTPVKSACILSSLLLIHPFTFFAFLGDWNGMFFFLRRSPQVSSALNMSQEDGTLILTSGW